ncbi:MAG: LacI family DNA-binding transcriptional regulator [Spirochaetales bacterium]|nr:LacI family DNA-binding transcriptional regulator [Spirochaetales bacterium]
MIKGKITLKTISEALELSKTTVSLVLKGDGDRYRISKATQGRILGYAEAVGFEPDFLASALVTKKTLTIGLIFPDVHELFMSEMIKGIELVLYPAGYSILLSTSGFNTEFELRNIRQMLRRKVDGLIIVPYIPIADKHYKHGYLREIKKAACPVIFVDRIPPENDDLNWIIQNDHDAAFEAVRLLHDRGCRNIRCLSFDLAASSVTDRIRGFNDGMKACGLASDNESLILLEKQDPGSEDLHLALMAMAEGKKPVDGLLVTTGGLAHKVKYLISKSSLDMQDIQIAKFGKDPDYFDTGMIQIIQPNAEMGKRAAQTILDFISDPPEEPVHLEINSLTVEGIPKVVSEEGRNEKK